MKIYGTEFNLKRNALEIYFSGCSLPHCDGCHNKYLQDFNIGTPWKDLLEKIESKIQLKLVKNIWLLGGDPADQDENELINFMDIISKYDKPIWLWTKYSQNQISENILKYITFLKSGPYDKYLDKVIDPLTKIELASSNQKIIKLK